MNIIPQEERERWTVYDGDEEMASRGKLASFQTRREAEDCFGRYENEEGWDVYISKEMTHPQCETCKNQMMLHEKRRLFWCPLCQDIESLTTRSKMFKLRCLVKGKRFKRRLSRAILEYNYIILLAVAVFNAWNAMSMASNVSSSLEIVLIALSIIAAIVSSGVFIRCITSHVARRI